MAMRNVVIGGIEGDEDMDVRYAVDDKKIKQMTRWRPKRTFATSLVHVVESFLE